MRPDVKVTPEYGRKKIAFLLFALVWTAFIWHNSMCPATVSSAQSGRAEQLLSPILDFLCTPEAVRQFVIRKAAHITEFAILGLLWSGVFRGSKPGYPFLLSAVTAGVDEGIQLFVPGRSGEIRDVLIDTAGAAAALVLLWLLGWLRERVSQRKMDQI